MLAEYNDFLPLYQFPPDLSDQDVARYVALGKQGWQRYRAGDLAGAESAFRGQIAIYPANPEPFVSLALFEAARGGKKEALAELRNAVVRGFTDLWRVERAEVWIPLRKNPEFLRMIDMLPKLVATEREWPGWSAFYRQFASDDLASVLDDHAFARDRIERMAPALGERQTRLWHRTFDRATAASLEAYVTQKTDAPDFGQALDRLLELYFEGRMLGWQRLPAAAAKRLVEVSDLALARYTEGEQRDSALLARALGRNAERDRKGALKPEAAEAIRVSLGELLDRDAGSALASVAAIGLIRTEMAAGRTAAAVERFRQVESSPAIGRVREELGATALRLGGLPAFEAQALDGSTVSAASLAGRVSVLDFWATWCRPCVDGLPALRKIASRHGDDVALIGVNLDSAEDLGVEELREWVASQGIPGLQLFDGEGWESAMVRAFGVKEIPFTVVVGPDGEVLAVNEHGKRLEKAVTAAVQTGARGGSTAARMAP